ncbi:homoserine dehydrogenase [Brevibacillus choshinensis]|uniref:Homoserine dehydrogenase n=1 Tax=Brevibacillus choshinensis TaxID=54911 RepID=A0ABX7FX63_BRECH|nr:homoserine dehydrogenase [Brevibacillus choshinensis]QRG70391.1 homoserine dehydrogenase [Brevibacillus choshinensis]
MKQWKVVITGYGSVGKQVARLLMLRQDHYRKQYGMEVILVGTARSTHGVYDEKGLQPSVLEAFAAEKKTGDMPFSGSDFIRSCQADVLIETGPSQFETGGPGLAYIRHALETGMHAIAVSKGALVVDYAGLSALAKQHGVSLKISGATAAALPTIDLLQYNLAGCEIQAVEGVFTGTTNFVLTSMMDEGISCEEAIARAQQLGIAEPDPSFDVDGWDTACKVTILANAAFGAQLTLSDIAKSSVREVTREQIQLWQQSGKTPKLIGSIRRTPEGLRASVELLAVDSAHPFANVKGTTKAIRVETDVMGDLLVIGGKSDPVAAAAAALKDLEHILSLQ